MKLKIIFNIGFSCGCGCDKNHNANNLIRQCNAQEPETRAKGYSDLVSMQSGICDHFDVRHHAAILVFANVAVVNEVANL
jgi:hypothetical protein